MLLLRDGDIRGSGLLFVMEQEAAGAAGTRMDFAFSLCLEHSCSFGNSPGAFSFGALEWKIKAARPFWSQAGTGGAGPVTGGG